MSGSIAIYGRDFARYVERGLAPEQFTYRFLAEGDSWMERSSAFTASLPDYLARAIDDAGESALIINLAMYGDSMRRIGESVGGEFGRWLNDWDFDAILLSAGGNDFIDAALDPPPGQGILRDLSAQDAPANGHECVNKGAVSTLVTDYLDPNFHVLYDAVRASRNADVPIFLNNYDTPVARDAPAPPSRHAWLFEAYRKNSIPPELWPDLTGTIFNEVQTTIAGWVQGTESLFVVPTNGTLVPAESGSTGSSGDWINEIHPNGEGWRKLALVWLREIHGRI